MYDTTKDLVIKLQKDRNFLDFFDRGNKIFITSYNYLDKEIIIDEDNNTWELGEKKKRYQVTSITELRNMFKRLILAVTETFRTTSLTPKYMQPCYYDISINDAEKELIEKQLVFDILFDEYLKKSEKVTLLNYANDMSNRLYGDNSHADAIRKTLKRSMEQYYDMIKYSDLSEELKEFLVNGDMYEKYCTPKMNENVAKKKPKIMWDYYYYNHNMLTYRQFRRQPMKDSNTSYEMLLEDLKEYDNFINTILPADNESVNIYMNKIMEYYYLESYKRIDFMLMLANSMLKIDISDEDINNIFVKHFHPKVTFVFEYEGNLALRVHHKYYRPLLMVEQDLFQRMQVGKDVDIHEYGIQLQKYQIIRAKAYEMFKYHAEYVLCDYKSEINYDTYKEIKEFICQYYNMKSYHESNEIWQIIKKDNWKRMDAEARQRMKKILSNFTMINDALFRKSPNREINKDKQ